MSKTIVIKVADDLYEELKKRAKKELVDIDGVIANMIQRSMISYKRKKTPADQKVDDKLVGIFSRSRRGRKPKKKKK